MANESSTAKHLLSQNPVIRRLTRVAEYDETNYCTYAGITKKLIFFVLMTAVGVAFGLLLRFGGLAGGEAVFDQQIYEEGENVVITSTEVMIVGIATLVFAISPFLAIFIRPTIPVTGTLYCASTGLILSWLAVTFADVYMAPVLLALVITLMLVVTMGFLYGSGIIKVTQKLRTILMSILLTCLLSSILVFIGSLIPFTRGFVSDLMNDPLISIGGGVLMVIVGTLFLLVDFDTVRECVEHRLPKKYEWYASFGLAFSVIWLYFKVLDLVIKIMGKSKD